MSNEDITKKDDLVNDELEDEICEEADSNLEATIKEANENENIQELKSKYENSIKDMEELNNRFLRLQADFTNYKKRVEKEKESTIAYAVENLLTQILPVLDNFDRALSVECSDENKALYEGMEMVYKQFIDILKNHGLEEIEALNEKFDPNYHYAVSQQESNEHEEDTIIQVLGKGYKLKDKVIRPSMVMVSK
ncbi:molecular chaperone GrpE [Gottschalkia purinilytica]|uniref:Protein GrpE n=1 Tax=Gottschalkia purinilytica TaxID=1503 RepID=A0A0L0WD01_GOTPU|nr:nucleotide exchange factor GrpE [Gottschalkia purinilytica]KNF09359.1 molecular chaperone GrpE [Gottschalkia purinilytica]